MSGIVDERHRPLRYAALAPVTLVSTLIVIGAFLPFVNRQRLWLGLPSLLVWCAAGVVLLTPCLLLVERYWAHGDRDGRESR
jgi:hypothetical protein